MRTTHVWIAGCAVLFAGGSVALTHCSSSNSSSPKGDGGHVGSSGYSSGGSGSGSGSSSGSTDDGGASSSSSSGGSGGGEGGTSSGSSEGGASSGGDGGGSSSGTTVPVPDGGAPSVPGHVGCGGMSCDTASQYCCYDPDGGACLPYNSGSCSSGVKLSCKEAADCASGVCCQPLQYGQHTTSCLPTCGTGNFQLCRTDAECGSADGGAASQKCIVQMCRSAAPPAPRDVKVEACAYPTTTGGFGGTTTWGPLPDCQ